MNCAFGSAAGAEPLAKVEKAAKPQGIWVALQSPSGTFFLQVCFMAQLQTSSASFD